MNFFQQNTTSSSLPQRVALINMGGLGDAVLFLPVITQLLKQLPESANLTLITENRAAGICDLLPSRVQVITLDWHHLPAIDRFKQTLELLKQGQYDAVISSGSHPAIAVLLAMSGIPVRVGYETGKITSKLLTHPAPLKRDIYAAEMHFELAKAFLSAFETTAALTSFTEADTTPQILIDLENPLITEPLSGKPIIGIHPGVSQASIDKRILKSWHPNNWLTLADTLVAQYPNCQIVLLGGPDDTVIVEALSHHLEPMLGERLINWAGQTAGAATLAAAIKSLDLLVCVDSAPMHMAVALGVKTVALFSATNEYLLLPAAVIPFVASRPLEEVPCRPCLFDKRQQSCATPICLAITVETVMRKITQALTSKIPIAH